MTNAALASALEGITSERLLAHISTLASDEFEGRAPGTHGEKLTLDYLTRACKEIGLEPAGDNGTYLQSMPVIGLTMDVRADFKSGEKQISLNAIDDLVVRSQWPEEKVAINSDMVFVGYGIVAPEYGWDDYKGIDVRGKTVVMLIGDPRREKAGAAGTSGKYDADFFKGHALTYYGRWTYKYEIASEKGAAAVLIVHDTERAGYGWDVVVASWGGENLGLGPDPNRVRGEGWLSHNSAEKLFAMGGNSLSDVMQAAQKPDFKPVELNVRADVEIANTKRTFISSNVVAKLTGSDPQLQDECIVYSAHWDHFGKREKNGEVEILSGALDNGSGVAVVLEIARAISGLKNRPRRSVIFLFPTLEEHGLLGAQYYVQHPAMPLESTVAVINFDIMNPWGRTRNLISVARGHSDLDQVIEKFAAEQSRTMGDDTDPDKGYFFRSDHLEFLRRGVPALFFLNPGDDFIGQPADYAVKKRVEYLTTCYHKAADKVNPNWDLSGMVEDTQLLLSTGLEVANCETRPRWNSSSEFCPRS